MIGDLILLFEMVRAEQRRARQQEDSMNDFCKWLVAVLALVLGVHLCYYLHQIAESLHQIASKL